MTLPRLDAVARHWKRVPPPSSSIAAIAVALGAVRQGSDAARQEPQQLLDALGGTQGFGSEVPEWLRAAEATKT